MLRIWRQAIGVFVFIISTATGAAVVPQHVIDSHEAAVEQARGGDMHAALQALNELISEYPEFYPAKRDYVVIATWIDDCDAALQGFNSIRNESPLEGYLVEPIAECLRDRRQLDEALSLLEEAVSKNPEDEDAQRALNDLKEYIKFDSSPNLYGGIGFNQTDQGNTDFVAELKYTHEITHNSRIYYRHLLLQADDPRFSTGDVSRASVGLSTWFGVKYLLDVAVFTDVANSGGDGTQANLNYYPNPLWEFGIGYNSSAEDIALRARAVGTKADSVAVGTAYHSKDYRWEWSANYSEYNFSDTNEREALGTALGYAFQMSKKNEQRVILDWYASQNSPVELDTPYYKPVEDSSLTLSFRNDHVYDTDWVRLVDHVTLYAGLYSQQAYGIDPAFDPAPTNPAVFRYPTKGFGGIGYELDWEFTRRQSLGLSLRYGSAVYDGVAERQTRASISYNHRL